eukprot:CAMPEP_0203869378 /NCGR_PEP_ID=MMETSP0359-20131031/17671_1 /ASSEMBLY_ACC=CAM_ASM_000338 /TAXON_ID=268821 /ORGANISM="Scrippsiella Hangoei, Strain SHTV-5" /LENGTH=38 /DNA_ID= /DNA_START= /DNA_END= /DNA_ORIENTATION=
MKGSPLASVERMPLECLCCSIMPLANAGTLHATQVSPP